MAYTERLREASIDLEKAYRLNSEDPELLVYLSFLSFRLEATSDVIRWSEKAIAADKNDAMAYNNRAYGLILKGDIDKAAKDVDLALSIDPKHKYAMNNRALIKFRKGDIEGALVDIAKVMEIDPKLPEAYLNRGYVRAHQGKHKEAIADFTKAIELRPWLRLAFDARAVSYDALGETENAEKDRASSAKLLDKINASRAGNR